MVHMDSQLESGNVQLVGVVDRVRSVGKKVAEFNENRRPEL